MPLYLTGGADQEHFKKMDQKFLASLPKGARVGILPQASEDYIETLERIEEEFDSPQVSKFDLVVEASEDLLNYDAIMIEGGNTFDLAMALRNSPFFNYLKKFHEAGRPIYADSAGAIILGSDIQTAFLGDDSDEDELKLQDYRGLDLIAPFAIHAHATPDEWEDLESLLYDKGSPILALAEETGIIVHNDHLEVWGDSELTVISFSGRKSLRPGTETTLQNLQE